MKGLLIASTGGSPGPVGYGGIAMTALAPVANRPLLLHALAALAATVGGDVAIAAAAEDLTAVEAALERGGVRGDAEVIVTDGPGVAAAIAAARGWLAGTPFIAQHADGLLAGPAPVAALLSGGAEVGLLVQARPATQPPDLAVRRLQRLGGPLLDGAGDVALVGAWAFAGAVAALVERRRADGHDDALADIVEAVHDGGGALHTEIVRGWRRFEGDVSELLELNRMVLDELDDQPLPAGLDGVSVQGRVLIDPTAQVSATIVRGPVVIGPNCIIHDAYIGPYSAIGAGARIEGTEVEHSMILPGACVLHLGRRLDGSVVGAGASVSRHFALPRGLRLVLGDGAEVAIC